MKTINRVYDSYAQAREAVRGLEAAGISAADISLVANKHVSREHADVRDVSDTTKGAGIGAALGGRNRNRGEARQPGADAEPSRVPHAPSRSGPPDPAPNLEQNRLFV